MPHTLHELLVRASERHPDRDAVVSPDSSISYVELYSDAASMAQALVAAGIEPGDRVGLCLPKSSDAIVAVYGILLSGASYVPIDPTAPTERAVQIAANVSIRALVTNNDKARQLAAPIAGEVGPLEVFSRDIAGLDELDDFSAHLWTNTINKGVKLPVVHENDLAYILHTSGSTGKPKGVAISHKSALAFVDMAAEFFSINADDRLCSQAPLHFDLSVFDLYTACRQGAALVLLPEFYSAFPKKYVAAIREQKISVWNSVASALTLMMENGQPDPESLQSVRVILFSGEAMPTKYLRMLAEDFPNAELYNGYGQTEANTSMYYRVESIPGDDWKIPIGRAFPEYEVFALDDNGMPITVPGVEGELFVSSDAVADGYWGNPELTATRFVNDPRPERSTATVFRTGDKVCLDPNGDFVFIGRADDMVKSRGYRIELGEIERSILLCTSIEAAACLALPDEKIGNRLIAFASPASGVTIHRADVEKQIRRQLPTYMIPENIIIREKLPRTSTGKVDRIALRDMIPGELASA